MIQKIEDEASRGIQHDIREDTKLARNTVAHREQQGGFVPDAAAGFGDFYGGLTNSSSSTEDERSVEDLFIRVECQL